MFIIGLILAVGGFWVSKEVKLSFLETLASQGILLDFGKTISAIGVFLILFKVIDVFYFTPLRESIQGRTTALEATFGEAESLRSEMTQMKTEFEARLAQTEAEAREKIQAQIREAQEMRTQLMAEATQKADQFLKRAQEDIARDKEQALTEIRQKVVTLSLQATEKLLQDNVDNERNRKLVDDFLAKVEVPR